MNIRRISALSALLVASVVAAPMSASAAALPALPDGYQDFVPDIDYDAVLSEALTVPGSVSCEVTKAEGLTGLAAVFVKAGTTFSLDDLQSNPLIAGQIPGILTNPSAVVETTCPVSIALPGASKPTNFSGKISNEALTQFLGTDSGTYSLDCSISGTIEATAKVALGGGVEHKFTMSVVRAAQSIPLDCTLAISFETTPVSTLSGSVSGSVSVTATEDAVACQGSADPTCIPISLSNAAVSITNASGKFAGYVGTGTYSFDDLFSLKSIDDKINLIKTTAGVLSVRSSNVRSASVLAESMKLNLAPGMAKPVIVYPSPAAGEAAGSITKNGKLTISATKGAACALSAKVKTKSATVATVKKVAANGVWKPAFSKAVAAKLAAKKGSKVAFTVSCKMGKKTLKGTKSATYTG